MAGGGMDSAADESGVAAEVRQRLERKFPVLDPAVIGDVVGETWRNFDGCRIRVYLPILVERAASAQLHTLAARLADELATEAARSGNVQADAVGAESV